MTYPNFICITTGVSLNWAGHMHLSVYVLGTPIDLFEICIDQEYVTLRPSILGSFDDLNNVHVFLSVFN